MDTPIWEQLAVVGAFIAFLGGVWAFVRWVLSWASKIISEQRTEWQAFMDKQNSAWIKSADERNQHWQTWLAEQNARECDSMSKVTTALDRLTEKLAAHDERVDERFNQAIAEVNKRPAPRAKP